MGKKRRSAGRTLLPDGFYWLRNFISLRGGGHVDEWKVAEIVGGKVRLIGVTTEWEQGCDYLRNAIWVRVEPPPSVAGGTSAIRTGSEPGRDDPVGRADGDGDHRLTQRSLIVAEGIVDAFIETHHSTAAYYARHPKERTEVVAEIARLIRRVWE